MENIMENKCPHRELCGGCCYQEIPYPKQLSKKEDEVHKLLEKAEIVPENVIPIEGCPEGQRFRYRNKMEYTFGDLVKDGPLCLGMHKIQNFMSIVTVDQCQLVPMDFNKILSYTLEFCVRNGYPKYHKKQHAGLLRNLIVRQGFRTGEILVNIVTTTDQDFDETSWAKGLLELSLDSRIVGILHTLNDAIADTVQCQDLRVLYGRDYYYEEIMGLRFQVHAFSFFQTNVDAVERLYSQAVGLIDGLSGKTVYDLYCGTGTISQVMARSADRVFGVEIVPESVESARANAALNGLDNCEFICGDVFKVLDRSAEGVLPKPDVIVVDPPRAGMTPDAVSKIASYGVSQIVYISCNPKSLVRNLSQFRELGYAVSWLKPFDNFPMTRHVECVALMSKANT